MDISVALCITTRVNVVCTSSDYSAFLAGKSCSWHCGNSQCEQHSSGTTIVITEGRAMVTTNCKDKFTTYLN